MVIVCNKIKKIINNRPNWPACSRSVENIELTFTKNEKKDKGSTGTKKN